MKTVLTDRFLKTLKPAQPGKRTTVWDAVTPSFGVRITDKGAVSFFVMRRMPGKKQPIRLVLGTYPAMTLATGRKQAAEALGQLVRGEHPRELKKKRAAAEEQRKVVERLTIAKRQANTFAALAEKYIKHIHRPRSEIRTAVDIERTIRKHLIPRFGEKLATEIRRGDIIAMVSEIADEYGPAAGKRALTYASAIFNWGMNIEFGGPAIEGGLDHNPCTKVQVKALVGKLKQRQRILSDTEIALVWNAAEGRSYPVGPFVRLLMLSAARRSEVAMMRWREVDLDNAVWTIPPERQKVGIAHEVPLTPMAVDLLRSLPRFTGGDFVFSSTGGKSPIHGFGKFKDAIDSALPAEFAHWIFHDLRRTVRTKLGELGVGPFIAELVIGHRQKGVHAVYDVHSYRDEKRDALKRWATRLRSIIAPRPTSRSLRIGDTHQDRKAGAAVAS